MTAWRARAAKGTSSWLPVLSLFFGCLARAPEPEPQVEKSAAPLPTSLEKIAVPPLSLGLLPLEDPERILSRYRPFAEHLGRVLSTTVSLVVSTSYDDLIARFAEERVDLVQLAPLAYVEAKMRVPKLQLLVRNIAAGSSSYSGYILARRDSGLVSLEDLRGKRFGFVEPQSASGYLYPYAFLLDNGIDPKRDFKEALMVGRHDGLINRLLDRSIDAGATYAGAWIAAKERGLKVSELTILAKTGRIPLDAWCLKSSADAQIAAQIRSVLLELSTGEDLGTTVLAALEINGFTGVLDSDYDQVRQVLLRLEKQGVHGPEPE